MGARFVWRGRKPDLIAELDGRIGMGIVNGPPGESFAVRVSGGREIHPIAGNRVAQLPVRVLPGKRPDKVSKHIGNVRGMERADALALRSGRPAREVVEVDRVMAGPGLQASPCAHLPAEYAVAVGGVERCNRLVIGGRRVDLEELVREARVTLLHS